MPGLTTHEHDSSRGEQNRNSFNDANQSKYLSFNESNGNSKQQGGGRNGIKAEQRQQKPNQRIREQADTEHD